MIRIFWIVALVSFISCGRQIKRTASKKSELQFTLIDEVILPEHSPHLSLPVGGLSGVQFFRDTLYLVSDDYEHPRFYKTKVSIRANASGLANLEEYLIKDMDTSLAPKRYLDTEDLIPLQNGEFVFISEGNGHLSKEPKIVQTNGQGRIQTEFVLPTNFSFTNDSKNKPRHNSFFEGACLDEKGTGIWVAAELPLETDGPVPTFERKGGLVRITHFDLSTKKATRQFTYQPDPVAKDPKGAFGINGVTALLQINATTFWIVERSYSEGYGTKGNTIKLYEVRSEDVTNTLTMETLEKNTIKPATKKLLLDFETMLPALDNQRIDNIEGITLGPKLSNKVQSVLLISDNNFNPPSIQKTQLLILAAHNF